MKRKKAYMEKQDEECAMNIRQLGCATGVRRCGSISRVAERLYMNRPNLICLIKAPEEGLNIMPSPAPPQHPTHTDIHHLPLPRV